MANRPSYRLTNSVMKSDVDKANGTSKIGASNPANWHESVEPPKPAPRRLNSKTDILEDHEKTDTLQV